MLSVRYEKQQHLLIISAAASCEIGQKTNELTYDKNNHTIGIQK